MKFNLKTPVLDYEGHAIKEPDNTGQMVEINFRTVINAALNRDSPGTPIDAETGAKIYHLTNRIWHSWKVDLTDYDTVLIKERAVASFPTNFLMRGRLEDFLAHRSPMVPPPLEDQDKELEEDAPKPTAKTK